jgi:hypothetical protein
MPTNAEYAKINIACKELGLDKHQLLADRYGLQSSKELNGKQTVDLLHHLESLGWRAKAGRQSANRTRFGFIAIKPGPAAAQQRKVLAMWVRLGYAPEKLHERVRRQFGIDRFEWVTEYEHLHVLITDLNKRLKSMTEGR